jgi:hypothetical protein
VSSATLCQSTSPNIPDELNEAFEEIYFLAPLRQQDFDFDGLILHPKCPADFLD